MTLDEMLILAKYAAGCCDEGSDGEKLGRAVLDMLGEAQPCGFDSIVSVVPWSGDMYGRVMVKDGPYIFNSGEARAVAAMLLRAADEAERKPG